MLAFQLLADRPELLRSIEAYTAPARALDTPASTLTGETPEWTRAATSPAFEDMRNAMLMVGLRVSGARRALGEVAQHVQDGACPVSTGCTEAPAVVDDFDRAMIDVESGLELLRSTLDAMEELLVPRRRCARLLDAAMLGDKLARHHTRPIGGVRWQSDALDAVLSCDRSVAVAMVSSALSLLGTRMSTRALAGCIDGSASVHGHVCRLSFTCALGAGDVASCASELRRVFHGVAMPSVHARAGVLELCFPLI